MKRLLALRSRSRPEPTDGARVLDIDGAEGSDVLETLAAETTREVYTALTAEARTASEVAEAVGTSLQNAHYHLEKLQDAGLIEVADTWYSEQGNEMPVYAPTNESLVLFAGPEDTVSALEEQLARVVGVLGVVAIGGIAVDRLLFAGASVYQSGGQLPDGGWQPVIDVGAFVSPGAVFVAGGVLTLAVLGLWSRR